MTTRRVVLSGCSGGGKSTLLAALGGRGFATVAEPGRRIVERESDPASPLLPWNDLARFAEAAIALALADHAAASEGLVFFDRGLVDALAALAHATGRPLDRRLADAHRYDARVFMVPPWPQIYGVDASRRHSLAEAQAEYERLLEVYAVLGYTVTVLPRVSVAERADRVLDTLDERVGC